LQLSPHRYELYRGIIHCYLALQRTREAVNIAANALHHLGQTPRILTLYASVLLKDPAQTLKGRSYLEKALSLDPSYTPAVFMLVDAYEQSGQRAKAIEILEKQIDNQPTNKLHHTLADLLVKSGEPEKALEHYTTALMSVLVKI
jgi:anaphase-promoting complex subunit 7